MHCGKTIGPRPAPSPPPPSKGCSKGHFRRQKSREQPMSRQRGSREGAGRVKTVTPTAARSGDLDLGKNKDSRTLRAFITLPLRRSVSGRKWAVCGEMMATKS